jgi:hypothetical protein
MKIDKVIFGVDDNPLYADFWPIQAKLCTELLGITPVLFKITDNETDFYHDGNGLVKNIDKESCPGIITSFLSQIVRMYGTKYFPNEVCITGDIDMLMFSKTYFVDDISQYSDDDLVLFDAGLMTQIEKNVKMNHYLLVKDIQYVMRRQRVPHSISY